MVTFMVTLFPSFHSYLILISVWRSC